MKKKYIIKKARKLLVEQINSHQTIVRNDMNNIETMSNMKGLSEVIPKIKIFSKLIIAGKVVREVVY